MNSQTTLPVYTPGILDHNLAESRPRLGALLMALASYSFSFVHAGTKVLSQDNLTVSQLILSRCLVLTLIILITSLFYKIPHGIFGPPETRKLLIARAIFGYLGLITFMTSIYLLRLGDAVTLSFMIPIFMVILAATFLDEIITNSDIIAILIGISGAICIAQPEIIFGHNTENILDAGSILGYINAGLSIILNGLGNVLVRKLGNQVHTLHIVFYFMLIPIIPSALWCYFIEFESITWPTSAYNWSWLGLMILTALSGQLFISKSLQVAPVSVVTPLIFLQVVFAFINDWWLFNLTPPVWSLLGAILVAISVIITTK